jgi:hypothetical protein
VPPSTAVSVALPPPILIFLAMSFEVILPATTCNQQLPQTVICTKMKLVFCSGLRLFHRHFTSQVANAAHPSDGEAVAKARAKQGVSSA